MIDRILLRVKWRRARKLARKRKEAMKFWREESRHLPLEKRRHLLNITKIMRL